ncbi:MAG: citrate synthase [Chloroflexota bacterium]
MTKGTLTAAETATISVGGKSADLPVVHGTAGDDGVDIGDLRAQMGAVTLDNGYRNTGSCTSSITYLDGDAGILRYRGYPIEQLAEKSTFLEVGYLLIYGELPTRAQLDTFVDSITRHSLIHEEMRRFFDSFPKNAHPMAVLSAGASALSTFYQDSHDPFNPDDVEISTHRLLAKMPTIAAWAYKKSIGQPYVYPRNDLDYASNFLNIMFSVPAEPYVVDPVVAEALDLLLVLHADHEQNCSTSTVRMVGSSHANLFASISAGLDALWGPLHGGANQAAIEMLEQIAADGGNVDKYVAKAKDKKDGFRLMGFGHPVYHNFDPRAKIIKAAADRVLRALGRNEPLFEIAQRLAEVALHDEYFIERKLYPNIDFYSGLIYRAIGFPNSMFTAMFAIGRMPGWIAHWREMIADPATKVGRPRQVYVGAGARDYATLERR